MGKREMDVKAHIPAFHICFTAKLLALGHGNEINGYYHVQ